MGSYTSEWAGALQDITDAGTAVTFTRITESEDAAGLVTPSSTTVTGYAIRCKGDPDTYKALSLVESSSPTLLFAPSTYGSIPLEGDTVTWGSYLHTVKSVNPVAPDGTGIIARVIVSR